jgi:CheY-like chemotaxis protein
MHGHDVRVAHDGHHAVRLAQHFRPNVIFLDFGLPDLTGYEVAQRLRQITELQGSSIVAVSGWGAKEDLAMSKLAGFDAHFTKPVAPARVHEFLESL